MGHRFDGQGSAVEVDSTSGHKNHQNCYGVSRPRSCPPHLPGSPDRDLAFFAGIMIGGIVSELLTNQDLAVRWGAGLNSHRVMVIWSVCGYTDHESRLSELTPSVVPAGSAPWGRTRCAHGRYGVVVFGPPRVDSGLR